MADQKSNPLEPEMETGDEDNPNWAHFSAEEWLPNTVSDPGKGNNGGAPTWNPNYA